MNSRNSSAIGRVTTGMKVSVAKGISASLHGRREDAMNLFWRDEEGKNPSVFENKRGGKKNPVAASLKEKKMNSLRKDCRGPIYRPHGRASPLVLQILKRR